MSAKIVVAYHKHWLSYDSESGIFLPIHVGKSLSRTDLGIIGDDTGDNISYLNPYYCEMTAMYYAWKNIKADYKGLCHYRRFFTFERESLMSIIIAKCAAFLTRVYSFIKPSINFTNVHSRFLSYETSRKVINGQELLLADYLKKTNVDIICTKKANLSTRNVEQHFSMLIGMKSMAALDDLMKDNQNLYQIYKKLLKGHKYTYGNMILMKNQYFEEYCNFIFPIMQQHHALMCGTLSEINPTYSRVTGYVAEILTATYIASLENVCSIKYLNTYFIEHTPKGLKPFRKFLIGCGFFHPLLLR